ncbi:recombinase family protein [bacterium]|nr:recombinase family protein [bacterium]
MKIKAIGYTRVSTEEQAKEGVSLASQEDKIRTYAQLHDIELMGIVSDKGASGKSLDRDGMNQILNMVETKEIDSIIVYKLDRLSRKTKDFLSLIDLFESKDIAFHSIEEKVDTKSANGMFFLTIMSAISQLERGIIIERTKEALNHKKKNGEWLGRIPFGFKIESNHLVDNPDEIKLIQKAKKLRRSGKSYRDISKSLNLSLGYVHKVINTNVKSLKSLYSKDLQSLCVH